MPDYLTAAARDVWFEEIEHVVANGINVSHSTTFATYCSIEAVCRATFANGDVPRAAFLSEKRKLAELLGISGLAARTTTGTTANALSPDANPWAALPDA
ncbi:hypothetical protein ASE73_07715 [Sphingomonas sp. Leaf24]|uniref:hypothetical protein n=1 Tax=unclassified Sphingomonas TaxID=196159 RepID=UPI000701369A|nr:MULTISPECIES: hypothetical protein [unclassified Sphingomonas]KQM20200.1 hypothetical protein ASE50_16825 [Sphingomonas sp. Leaf5]KQM89463.1 hypothetical protein ASE73_07715 [Sphingomonas sp. Leaf24]